MLEPVIPVFSCAKKSLTVVLCGAKVIFARRAPSNQNDATERWSIVVRVLAGALLAVACSSSSGIEVDRKHCERLRDHLVDLRLDSVPKDVDVKAHRAAMKQALGEKFIEGCMDHATVSDLECGLKASDLATATACKSSN